MTRKADNGGSEKNAWVVRGGMSAEKWCDQFLFFLAIFSCKDQSSRVTKICFGIFQSPLWVNVPTPSLFPGSAKIIITQEDVH